MAIHDAPTAPGQEIRIPGERRVQVRKERTTHGIPIDAATRKELDELGEELGVHLLAWNES